MLRAPVCVQVLLAGGIQAAPELIGIVVGVVVITDETVVKISGAVAEDLPFQNSIGRYFF